MNARRAALGEWTEPRLSAITDEAVAMYAAAVETQPSDTALWRCPRP